MEPPRELIGAWRLTAYDDRESVDEAWVETYGPHPLGLLVYDASGSLSVQICMADGSRFDAYFGRFAVVEVAEENGDLVGIVHHNVVAGSMPELLTADPGRPFRISAETLTLGDGLTWRRVFRRVV